MQHSRKKVLSMAKLCRGVTPKVQNPPWHLCSAFSGTGSCRFFQQVRFESWNQQLSESRGCKKKKKSLALALSQQRG